MGNKRSREFAMKIKIFSLFFLSAMLVTSCNTQNATPVFITSQPSIAGATSTVPIQPELTTSSIPITVTFAAKTANPALEPSPTSTPIPAMLTDIPTLPAEDAQQRLLALLANNGNCQLPCLWGITPGESSYQDARSILLPLRGIAETAYFDFTSYPVDDVSPLYIESDLRLNTRVAYVYSNDSVVNYIIFRALEEQLIKVEHENKIWAPIFNSPTFLKHVKYYSLSHVLSEQGVPDSVMIQASGELISGFLDIALFYPEQGIWANYKTVITSNNGIVKSFCPVNSSIELALYPPGNSDSFYKLLDETSDWGMTKAGYKPLEEATSMSVKQFYETFRQSTDKCIETPSILWPTPERGGG